MCNKNSSVTCSIELSTIERCSLGLPNYCIFSNLQFIEQIDSKTNCYMLDSHTLCHSGSQINIMLLFSTWVHATVAMDATYHTGQAHVH